MGEKADYHNLFVRAVNSGGVYSGIFKEEPPASLLQILEKCAWNIMYSQYSTYLLDKGYSDREVDEYLPRVVTKISKWEDSNVQPYILDIVKTHKELEMLYHSTVLINVRENVKNVRSGSEVKITIPPFKDFFLSFVRRLASEPFVSSVNYFQKNKILERKFVHMDAMREALNSSQRGCVRVVNSPSRKEDVTSNSVSNTTNSSSSSVTTSDTSVAKLVSNHSSSASSSLSKLLGSKSTVEDDVFPEDSASNVGSQNKFAPKSQDKYMSPFKSSVKSEVVPSVKVSTPVPVQERELPVLDLPVVPTQEPEEDVELGSLLMEGFDPTPKEVKVVPMGKSATAKRSQEKSVRNNSTAVVPQNRVEIRSNNFYPQLPTQQQQPFSYAPSEVYPWQDEDFEEEEENRDQNQYRNFQQRGPPSEEFLFK